MPDLPTGTVTFLFTDIEGSTRLWEEQPEAMQLALAHHDSLLRAAIEINHGMVFKTVGDAFCAVFASASDAVGAALAIQKSIDDSGAEASALSGLSLRVRIGLHTGGAQLRDGDYFGPALNRVARLMAAAHGGQALISGATQSLVEEKLPPGTELLDLGYHQLRDLNRAEHVFQLLHPDLPSRFPALKSVGCFPNNLPEQLTSFVGREQEIYQLKEMLRTYRLVTLTGPGGTGKTRLALQAAAEMLEEFTDGVYLVDLAPVTDPKLISPAISHTLGVREERDRPILETLKSHLADRQMLLLMDNFEQVVSGAGALAELLSSCSKLRALVTSRAALKLRGERDFPVSPLPFPQKPGAARELLQYAAIELFVQRAQEAKPGFDLTLENAATVTEICERLDGLPLAIELAASRVRVLPPLALLGRLGNRLKLLTGGARDLPARQQTLRDTIGWSYDLLEAEEQKLFRRLSVFAAGCTLEAAAAVRAAHEDLEVDILDGVSSLVEKSLLRQEETREGEPRFRMLETLREYGQERLHECGEAAAAREAHAGFFVGLAGQAEPELTGRDQAAWLERLLLDHDNLRAALEWATNNAPEDALAMCGDLWRFWYMLGYLEEGRERVSAALGRAGDARSAARAKALNAAGCLAYAQGDFAAARSLHEETLAIFRQLGDRRGTATSLQNLGLAAYGQGSYAAARRLHEESLAIRRELGDRFGIANSLNNLANVVQQQGDYDAARLLQEESLALKRELGDRQGMAYLLNNLGNVAYYQHDYAASRSLHEESLLIKRELGDRQGVAYSLNNLGGIAQDQGNFTAARLLHLESLEIVRELGDRRGIVNSLTNLGAVAQAQQDYAAARSYREEALVIERELGDRRAIAYLLEGFGLLAVAQEMTGRGARLLAAAEALRADVGAPLPPNEQAEYNSAAAGARATLGAEAFAAAWEGGRGMTMEEAVAYALEEENKDQG